MWLFLCIIWFAIGCVNYWYLMTRVEKTDIMLRDIGKMIFVGALGIAGVVVVYFILNHDKSIFKAKD